MSAGRYQTRLQDVEISTGSPVDKGISFIVLLAHFKSAHFKSGTHLQLSNDMEIHPYQNLSIDERVKRVLANTPLIDGHNDLPQQPRACFHGKIHGNEKFYLNKGFQRGMTDIPRLREGSATIPASDVTFVAKLHL